MNCKNCGKQIDDGALVCPNCNELTNVQRKNNGDKKNLIIFMLIIVVIMLAGILLYIILNDKNKGISQNKTSTTSSTKTTTAVELTRDEKVRRNFLADIEKIKLGDSADYIICDRESNIDCTKITNFSIVDIEYKETYDRDPFVYFIRYNVTCEDENTCFYDEQYETLDDDPSNVFRGSSYYQVDENGNIIKNLGKSYPSLYLED